MHCDQPEGIRESDVNRETVLHLPAWDPLPLSRLLIPKQTKKQTNKHVSPRTAPNGITVQVKGRAWRCVSKYNSSCLSSWIAFYCHENKLGQPETKSAVKIRKLAVRKKMNTTRSYIFCFRLLWNCVSLKLAKWICGSTTTTTIIIIILRTSHIIRKVLQCEAWSLSGGDHRWLKRSTGKKRPVTTDIHIV